MEEITEVIKGLKLGSSPGSDGITNAFYKKYWEQIGTDFHGVVNEIIENGEMCSSQYLGVIILLYKAGERENLKNWRPITLLNSDYKIIEKVIAKRTKTVLKSIINEDQKGYLEGRDIGENVRMTEDVIYYCEKYEQPGAVIYIDQSKAFDRVEWKWLDLVMKKYGFGNKYIRWISTLYKYARSTIFTNGYMSGTFPITRGVRQGSPLGPYLYILQNEPFAESIRKDKTIHGIRIDGNMHEIKLSAFADDTQGYVRDRESINKWFIWLYVYSKASGAKVNVDKTKGTALGPLKQVENLHPAVQWTKGPVNCLGVNQGIEENADDYWNNKLEKMRKVFALWKMRNLTCIGKVHLIKSVGLSIFQYAWDVKTVPENVIKEVEKIMWAFIWDDKPERVRRVTCRRKRTEGGLGVPDVKKLIEASRIKLLAKVLEPGNQKWKILPKFFIGVLNKNQTQIMKATSCLESKTLKKCPSVYKECIIAWSKLEPNCKFPNRETNTILNYFPKINQGEIQEEIDNPIDESCISVKMNGIWLKVLTMKRKHVYDMLNKSDKNSTSEDYWERKYGNINWKKIYVMLTNNVFDRNVIEFQWKCLNGAIMTEKRVKYFSTSDGMCPLCGAEQEDLSHILLECDTQGEFWKEVIKIVKSSEEHYEFKETDVMLVNEESCLVNMFLMNAKWILWKRRCMIKYDNRWINDTSLIKWYKNVMSEKCMIGKLSKNQKVTKMYENVSLQLLYV